MLNSYIQSQELTGVDIQGNGSLGVNQIDLTNFQKFDKSDSTTSTIGFSHSHIGAFDFLPPFRVALDLVIPIQWRRVQQTVEDCYSK